MNATTTMVGVDSRGTVRAPTPLEWAPEVQVLLACARLRLTEEDAAKLRRALSAELDWRRLFRLTILHRLNGFVTTHLNSLGPEYVPEEYLEALKTRFLREGSEMLRQTAELLDILATLEKGGVFAVPYKGPALAQAFYGNLAFRVCNDLDILVSRRDVPRARQVLEAAGFRPYPPISPAGRDFILKTRHSEIYERPSCPSLELHWAFAKQRGVFQLDLEQLRPRLTRIALGGTEVPMFSDEDHLLILCVHGANHLWSRMEWLCGVAELIRAERLQWPVVLDRARQFHSERTLLLGLLLAHDLLDAPVPGEIIEDACADRSVVGAASTVQERYATCRIERYEAPNSWPRDLFRLRLQSSTGDRVRYLLHRMITPGREDTRLMLPLGSKSFPLAAIVRPFHVLGKLFGDLFHRQEPSDSP